MANKSILAAVDDGTTAPSADNGLADQEIPLSLDEFCIRQSMNDTRVELLGAFSRMEAAAGRTKAVQSVFAARYDAFANQPA